MRRFGQIILVVLGLAPEICAAQDQAQNWRALMGKEMRPALSGRVVTYSSGAVQDFRASGRTLYNAGQDSWGYWRIEGDKYCSQWPPSDLWACYGLMISGDGSSLRFVGASGDVSDGAYSE